MDSSQLKNSLLEEGVRMGNVETDLVRLRCGESWVDK
jgi:hypothetical protein